MGDQKKPARPKLSCTGLIGRRFRHLPAGPVVTVADADGLMVLLTTPDNPRGVWRYHRHLYAEDMAEVFPGDPA